MNFSRLVILIVSLTFSVPCFAGNTGGGGVFGLTVLKNTGVPGALKQQQLDFPVEYLGQIGDTDVLKTSATDFINLQKSIKAAGVIIRSEDKVIHSFILKTDVEDGSIYMETLEGSDVRIVKTDVEVDSVDEDQPDSFEETAP